jgi:hypothetical protein
MDGSVPDLCDDSDPACLPFPARIVAAGDRVVALDE